MGMPLKAESKNWQFGPFRYFRYRDNRAYEIDLFGFYVSVNTYTPRHVVLGLTELGAGFDALGSGKFTSWLPVPTFNLGLSASGLELAVGFHVHYTGPVKKS